jgi:hypothetical protein
MGGHPATGSATSMSERPTPQPAHTTQPFIRPPLRPLADSVVLVTGVVRNGEAHLAQDVTLLAAALAEARAVKWLLIESDSDDQTLSELQALQERLPHFHHESLGALRSQLPLRTARIAHCRNHGLAALRQDPAWADVDLVVVADFDGTNPLINANAIRSCWARDDWDVCTANQDAPYYDIYALRHPAWSPNDCWAQYRFLKPRSPISEYSLHAAVYARMIRIPQDGPWIEVDSAFGGLALYRRHALDHGSYIGLTSEGAEVCEHVALHAAMRAQGCHIAINPRLVNAGYTAHSEPLRWRARLARQRSALNKLLRLAIKRALGMG